MNITELSLFQFRNILNQTVRFETPVTFIVGQNGQGKTSILEACYLLSHASSFRNAKSSELIHWNAEQKVCRVSGTVQTVSGQKQVSFEAEGQRRKVLVNNKRISQAAEFYGQFSAVCFAPDDLEIVKGAPAHRRHLIDRTLSLIDSTFVSSSVRFTRALKQRNALLQKQRKGPSTLSPREFQAALLPWEHELVESGQAVAQKRNQFLKSLKPLVTDCLSAIARTAETSETIELNYESNFFSEHGTIKEKDTLLQEFEMNRERDLKSSSTRYGVHRDDIGITLVTRLGSQPARQSCSQGQARSIVLALKLASSRLLNSVQGEPPVVLLDDVESELDEYRKEALYGLIRELNSQVIITSTELPKSSNFYRSEAEILEVFEGQIAVEN